jgi:heptosyltransferase III
LIGERNRKHHFDGAFTERAVFLMKSILVIRGGAIGDFILTLPVLAALRRQFPNSRIELLANLSVAALAVEFSLADKMRDLGSALFAPLFSDSGKCSAEVARWFGEFDTIISYIYDPQRTFEKNVRSLSKAEFLVGPHRPDEQIQVHASVQILQPLRSRLTHSPDVERLHLRVARSSADTIAVHPGSGSRQKNWPIEKWQALLDYLVAKTDHSILLIGGEAERDFLPRLADTVPPARRQVALDLPLVEVARRLRPCRAFVGHDSGITHLAAVLGVQCVVLWGPTNENIWKPLGGRSRILRHPDGLSFLPVDDVVNTLNSLLKEP